MTAPKPEGFTADSLAELATSQWHEGQPPSPWGSEWFLAELTHGEGLAVLRELPKDRTYDFTTADHTHYLRERVSRWAQFKQGEFVPYRLADADDFRACLDERNKERLAAIAERDAAIARVGELERAIG